MPSLKVIPVGDSLSASFFQLRMLGTSSTSRSVRMMLSILLLGLAIYLVFNHSGMRQVLFPSSTIRYDELDVADKGFMGPKGPNEPIGPKRSKGPREKSAISNEHVKIRKKVSN